MLNVYVLASLKGVSVKMATVCGHSFPPVIRPQIIHLDPDGVYHTASSHPLWTPQEEPLLAVVPQTDTVSSSTTHRFLSSLGTYKSATNLFVTKAKTYSFCSISNRNKRNS